MRITVAVASMAAAMALAVTARAEDGASSPNDATPDLVSTSPNPDGEPPSAGTTVLALGATLIPGFLVHGSGHFVLGRKRTAGRLLMLHGIGLGLMFAGISNLVLTNASRYVTRSSVVMLGLGSGVFMTSSFADLVGVAVPLEDRGVPLTNAPIAQVEAGYRVMVSPALPQTHLAVAQLDLRWHGLHVQPSLTHALDHPAARQRFQIGYRGFGPSAGRAPSRDGSFLQLDGAVTRHALTQESVATVTGEVFVHGRLDLERIDPMLTGMFGFAGVGMGLQSYDYEGAAAADREALALVRSGFGAYLGNPEGPNGEVTIYYDQRHDDFVGGLNDRAVGIPGYVGLSGHGFFSAGMGLRGILEVGANVVGGVSWLVRSP